ncbi:hypothetical protein HSBAA_56690 [Vreelandella sulfidaeris]|uniref:Uncharacterized protein n=1 Tax=Vreelandella sulfidaeris TaxID=115553 RepID=A0A455UG80_9GAMM|nr:hypothetical protein HSBAA_56690 [Halomonas sulfidaeris]
MANHHLGQPRGVFGERLSLELYGISDVSLVASVGMIALFLVACLATIGWIFRTGYRLKP